MAGSSKYMQIIDICKNAKKASSVLFSISGSIKQNAINKMAENLVKIKKDLFEANKKDIEDAERMDLPLQFIKRLAITENVFDYMGEKIKEIALLPDPVGRILDGHISHDGLKVHKVSVPIGVIGIIYESRPNVTTDSACICIKSGNACILRGGSEALRTNLVLAKAMNDALGDAGIPEDALQMIGTAGHEAVDELLKMDKFIDVLIPRGGKDLIKKISEGTRIPTIKHYEGLCHYYVSKYAPEDMAVKVIINSKCQSVEVCNALEKLLIDKECADKMVPVFAEAFKKAKVELRGCEKTRLICPGIKPATEEDWVTEYLAPILTVKVVDNIDDAIIHINTFGSHHTDGIISTDYNEITKFTSNVDSSSVMVNASTRLSGGSDYGIGAAIGISTDRLHARGPVGPNDLTTYKWLAYGNGQIRN